MNDDGVALTSIAHPVSPWYRRICLWFRPPRLSPDSLETIEIDIKDVERRATSGYALSPNYEPTKGLRLDFKPGLTGLYFTCDDPMYPEDNGPHDMKYINSLIEADERRREQRRP